MVNSYKRFLKDSNNELQQGDPVVIIIKGINTPIEGLYHYEDPKFIAIIPEIPDEAKEQLNDLFNGRLPEVGVYRKQDIISFTKLNINVDKEKNQDRD